MDFRLKWCTTELRTLGMTRLEEKRFDNEPNGLEVGRLEVRPTDKRVRTQEGEEFSCFYHDGLFTLTSKLANGELQNRDFVVLMIYAIHSDWRTGRCRLTIQRVAEILKHKVQTLYPSIRRLKEQNLLVPIQDSRTGEKLYIISPFILKAGSNQARGLMLKTYFTAINRNNPEDSTIHDEPF